MKNSTETTQKTLKQLAQELTQKNSWLRKNLQIVLDTINKQTKTCEIIRQFVFDDDESNSFRSYVYYLKTGSETKHCLFRVPAEAYQYSMYQDAEYMDAEEIPDNILRHIIQKLPLAIQNLKQQMESKINFEFPDINS